MSLIEFIPRGGSQAYTFSPANTVRSRSVYIPDCQTQSGQCLRKILLSIYNLHLYELMVLTQHTESHTHTHTVKYTHVCTVTQTYTRNNSICTLCRSKTKNALFLLKIPYSVFLHRFLLYFNKQ